MTRKFRSLSGVILLVLIIATKAYACDCAFGGTAVCQDYWKASAVFLGTVIESKTLTIKRGEYDQQQRLVRFSLE